MNNRGWQVKVKLKLRHLINIMNGDVNIYNVIYTWHGNPQPRINLGLENIINICNMIEKDQNDNKDTPNLDLIMVQANALYKLVINFNKKTKR